MLSETALALKLLQVILGLDKLVDLIDEVRLRFSDDGLNFVDLLIDNLVDFLHMVKHLVGLLVQRVQLLLVVLELDLAVVHLLAGVVLLNLRLHTLQNLLLVVLAAIWVEIRILMLAVVHSN